MEKNRIYLFSLFFLNGEIIFFSKTVQNNAASESFNAKTKQFRAHLRGVKDMAFFLFRLSKIYA